MRTSFHHQSEAQPPNGRLTAATGRASLSLTPSHAPAPRGIPIAYLDITPAVRTSGAEPRSDYLPTASSTLYAPREIRECARRREEKKMEIVRRQFLHLAGSATALFASPYVVQAQEQAPKLGVPPPRPARDRLEEALARIADPKG